MRFPHGHFPNILFTKMDESRKTCPKKPIAQRTSPESVFHNFFFVFSHFFFIFSPFFSFFKIFSRFYYFFPIFLNNVSRFSMIYSVFHGWRFLTAHRVIKRKLFRKNIISYVAPSNQKFEAFLKYLKKIWNHGSSSNSFTWEKKEKNRSSAKMTSSCKVSNET